MSVDPATLSDVYLGHALAGRDREAVRSVLDPLVTGELALVDLYERVLGRAAERVGELWHRSEISVADEHFVTQLNQRVIAVATAYALPPVEHAPRVVLACPPDELHDTGLRMLGHLLAAHGYETHTLGAATPTRDLVDYVTRVEPTAVGLSVASPLSISSLARTTDALRAANAAVRIFVGGRCAELYDAVPAAVGATRCVSLAETLAYLDS